MTPDVRLDDMLIASGDAPAGFSQRVTLADRVVDLADSLAFS